MRRKHILVLLAGAVFMAVVFNLSTRWSPDGGVGSRLPSASRAKPTKTASAASARVSSASDAVRRKDATRQLEFALAALKGITNANEAQQILSDLRTQLAALPPEIASATIADFLNEPTRDATTRIEFSVGKTGFLDGQPSLRTALLDWLGQIDPAQAEAMAEKILATPTHADEWAVCLRNYARVHPGSESRDFLRTKTEELIRNRTWRENPSVGFLESFDVLVHAHATESSALLGELVADRSPEGKALAHAAYLTLDRLTIREPVAMMRQLAAQSELIKVRGPMVANMLARADLRDPEQRQLVRDYLLDPSRISEDLSAFAGTFPNANLALSKNLLTETRTPTRDVIVAHDAAVLETVKAWLKDPAFEPIKPHLTIMHNRLETFVRQSAEGNKLSP